MKWIIATASAAVLFGSVSAQAAEQLVDEQLDDVTAGAVLIDDPVVWSAGEADTLSISTATTAGVATSISDGSTASGIFADFILLAE